jgi:hypothetical protein
LRSLISIGNPDTGFIERLTKTFDSHYAVVIIALLTKHYGFKDEKPDFIPSVLLRAGIKYDIKHRMGRDREE